MQVYENQQLSKPVSPTESVVSAWYRWITKHNEYIILSYVVLESEEHKKSMYSENFHASGGKN